MDADNCQIFQEGQTPTACQVTKGRGTIVKTCLVCGDWFKTYPAYIRAGGGKYCSSVCYRKSKINSSDHICQQCGKPVYDDPSSNRLFCSRECYFKSRTTKVERVCPTCNKLFYAKPSDIQKNKGKYCSRECSDKGRRISRERVCKQCGSTFLYTPGDRGEYCSRQCYGKSRYTPVECVCPQCGKGFMTKPSALGRGKGKYCSKECSDKGRSHPVSRFCEYCGKEFVVQPYKVRDELGKYCSKHCSAASRTGERANSWRGGLSFKPYCPKFNDELKERVRAAFGRKCYLCPTTEKDNGRKLDVHHVDYQKSQGCKGKPWSLIPLCVKCHVRTGKRRYYWFCLLRDYWLNSYLEFITLDLTMW